MITPDSSILKEFDLIKNWGDMRRWVRKFHKPMYAEEFEKFFGAAEDVFRIGTDIAPEEISIHQQDVFIYREGGEADAQAAIMHIFTLPGDRKFAYAFTFDNKHEQVDCVVGLKADNAPKAPGDWYYRFVTPDDLKVNGVVH
jgi:hypothetical protein